MKATIARLLQQFDARSIRERVLIGLTMLCITWAVWIASVGGLVLDNKAEVVTSIERLAKDMQLANDERLRLKREDTAPMRTALARQQQRLQGLIVTQQTELDELLARFIPPEDVPMLLEDVLHNYAGLKLIRLSSKPAEPLQLEIVAGDSKDEQRSEPGDMVIYRHPVELEFEGGYLDVLAYLTALESVSWRFAWRRFEYAVRDYPTAQVVIELETLSREREWLGV